MGGYEHHEEGKDAKVCVTPATFLSSSAQEDAMFQLPCSESNCRIEESREKLCVKRNGGNTEGRCRSSRWKEDEEMGWGLQGDRRGGMGDTWHDERALGK